MARGSTTPNPYSAERACARSCSRELLRLDRHMEGSPAERRSEHVARGECAAKTADMLQPEDLSRLSNSKGTNSTSS